MARLQLLFRILFSIFDVFAVQALGEDRRRLFRFSKFDGIFKLFETLRMVGMGVASITFPAGPTTVYILTYKVKIFGCGGTGKV